MAVNAENLTAADAVEPSDGLGTPGSSGASQTDDEILGLVETGSEASEAPAQEQQEVPEEQEVEPSAEEEIELPVESAPEWLKPLLNNEDQKVAAEAKSMWNRFQGYSGFGPVSELRKLKETVDSAGGVDALREMQQESLRTLEADDAYYSADPERQTEYFGRLYQDDPQAFLSGMEVQIGLVKSADPANYDQFLGQAISEKFAELAGVNDRTGESKFQMHLEAIEDAAYRKDEQALAELGLQLGRWFIENSSKLGMSRQRQEARLDPGKMALDREREKFSTQQEGFYRERYDAFLTDLAGKIDTQIRSQAEAHAARALANVKISEGAKKRIIQDIYDATGKAVGDDANHRNQVTRVINPSGKQDLSQFRTDAKTTQQVVNLAIQRAKQAMPGIAKRIITEWTNDIIAGNRAAIAKAKAAGARPDIASGVPKGYAGKKPITREEARTMDELDIINSDRPVSL